MPGVGSVLALLGAAPVTGLATAHALYGPCGIAAGVYAGAGASLVPLVAAAVVGYRASVDDPPVTVQGPDNAGPTLDIPRAGGSSGPDDADGYVPRRWPRRLDRQDERAQVRDAA